MDDVHGIFTDECRQRCQTGRYERIAHQTGQACIDTADTAADHGSDERLFELEDDTVQTGFGDAHDSGETGGECQLAQLMVLGLAGNGQRCTALCDVGGQHTGAVNDLIAQRGNLHGCNRSHCPGRTGQNEEGLECTHEHGQQPACGRVDGVCSVLDERIEEGTEGADDQQRDGCRNEQNDQRFEEKFNDGRRVFFRQTLDVRHNPDAQNNRDDRIRVVNQTHRDAEKVDGFACTDHAAPRRMQQCTGQRHCQHRIACELDRRTIGQQNGHEVEGCVRNKVQNLVGRAAIAQAAQNQNGQNCLNHTTTDQRRDDRCEGGRDDTDDAVDDRGLFLRCGVLCGVAAGRRAAHLIDQGTVGHRYVVANNHLELSALLHDTDDACGFFDRRCVHLAAVMELKAQTGCTMGQFADVLYAADQRNQIVREFFVIHKNPLSLAVCGLGLAPAPCAKPLCGHKKRPQQKHHRIR